MLRMFRDEHIYSLAFEKSLQISKVIHKSTFETNLKERRRKTKTVHNVRLQSIYKNLTGLQD